MARLLLRLPFMMKRVVAVAVVLSMSVGCSPQLKAAAGGSLVAGAAGVWLVDMGGDGVDDSLGIEPSSEGELLAGGMLLAGIALIGVAIHERHAEDAARRHQLAMQPAWTSGPPGLAFDANSAYHGISEREREQDRLALQTSVTARAGHCEAAVMTGGRLARLDQAMYDRLVTEDEAFARCLARTR